MTPIRYLMIFAIIAVLLTVSFAASSFPGIFSFIYFIPGGDKIGHFSILAIVTFLVNILLAGKKIKIFGHSVFAGSMAVFILITIDEFSQLFISSRSFEYYDLLANYSGIFLPV